jgi:beta-N-acetylhexosaminidase
MTRHGLSLQEKVGQLFMVGFEGTELTSELGTWLSTYGWGGVILFGRNVESPTQVQRLTQGLQEQTAGPGAWPLLIAVDQEGGRVARLKAPFTPFPSAAHLGRTGSETLVYDVGYALGQELRAIGINMDMAPVLDVLTNPANTVIGDRAFSAHADRVACLGGAFIRGIGAAGVLPVGKHFPGHGDTVLDSHVALPLCERSLDQLEACELRPFRAALAAGLQAIMTAHVVYPVWDERHPATLSPGILRGVLRQTLGFQGVIVSDDLGMAAVTEALPWDEIPLQALRAGVDLLLICHGRQRQERAHGRVLQAVQSGAIPETWVDQAVTRILALKAELRRLLEGAATPPLSAIGNVAHQALVEAIHARVADAAVERHTHGE